KSPAEAEKMLELLSGRAHRVVTGVCLLGPDRDETFHVSTEVVFRPLGAEEIRAYVKTGEPMDKAGAYAIQGGAAGFVREIHGSYTNVVGLPLAECLERLRSGAHRRGGTVGERSIAPLAGGPSRRRLSDSLALRRWWRRRR